MVRLVSPHIPLHTSPAYLYDPGQHKGGVAPHDLLPKVDDGFGIDPAGGSETVGVRLDLKCEHEHRDVGGVGGEKRGPRNTVIVII